MSVNVHYSPPRPSGVPTYAPRARGAESDDELASLRDEEDGSEDGSDNEGSVLSDVENGEVQPVRADAADKALEVEGSGSDEDGSGDDNVSVDSDVEHEAENEGLGFKTPLPSSRSDQQKHEEPLLSPKEEFDARVETEFDVESKHIHDHTNHAKKMLPLLEQQLKELEDNYLKAKTERDNYKNMIENDVVRLAELKQTVEEKVIEDIIGEYNDKFQVLSPGQVSPDDEMRVFMRAIQRAEQSKADDPAAFDDDDEKSLEKKIQKLAELQEKKARLRTEGLAPKPSPLYEYAISRRKQKDIKTIAQEPPLNRHEIEKAAASEKNAAKTLATMSRDQKTAAKAAKEAEKEAAKAAKKVADEAAKAAKDEETKRKVAENVKKAALAEHAIEVNKMNREIVTLTNRMEVLTKDAKEADEKQKELQKEFRDAKENAKKDPTETKKKFVAMTEKDLNTHNNKYAEIMNEQGRLATQIEYAEKEKDLYLAEYVPDEDRTLLDEIIAHLPQGKSKAAISKTPRKKSVVSHTSDDTDESKSSDQPPKSAAKSSKSKQPKKELKPVSAFEQHVFDLLRIGDFPSDKMMSNAKDMKKKIWNNTKKRLQNISVNKEHPNVDYTSIFNAMDSEDNIIEKLKKSEKPDGEMFNNLPMDVPAKLPNASVKSGEEWIAFFTNVWENLTPPPIDE